MVKFLCGYEYITSIGLASIISIVYYSLKYEVGLARCMTQLLVCASSFVFAFLVAITLHSRAISEDWSVGINHITTTATKRISSHTPELLAKEVCGASKDFSACEKLMIDSLNSNSLAVASKYFIMPHFLPWINRAIFSQIDKKN